MLGRFRHVYFGAVALYALSGGVSLAAAVLLLKGTASDALTNTLFMGIMDLLLIFLISGIVALISSLTGVFGLVNPINRRLTLRIYGATILVVVALQMVVACLAWFETLQMRAFIESHWLTTLTNDDVNILQNKFSCCGFSNITDRAVFSPSCAADDPVAAAKPGCRDPIATSAVSTLVTFYTAIFGAMFVDLFAFLTCVIMAQYRNDEARFRKIDAKKLAGPGKLQI